MDLVFWLFGLGAVQDFEEVGRPAAHARVQVGLWGRVCANSKSAPSHLERARQQRTGALEVVVDVVAEHLDLGDGGGCDLRHRVPREQD